MKTKNIEIEDSGFRCSKKKLERIISQVPVEFVGNNLRLKAFMGLGKKIYIEQIEGSMSAISIPRKVELGPLEIDLKKSRNKYLIFYYKKQSYQLEYKSLF